MKRLQTIQYTLARAVTKTPKHHHITPVLKSLHWLKVPQRIHYKIVSLTDNRGVQYVHWVMHKCIMVKVGEETKYT